MHYKKNCRGCEYAQGIIKPTGGIAKLTGKWTVNQFGGSEAYLGWLALQPQFHYNAISELTPTELSALGPNIKALDRVLTNYWKLKFPMDRVEQVYMVYFFESKFRKPQEEKPFHLHIHVIPRFKSLRRPGGLYVSRCGVIWADAWQVPLLSERGVIPESYRPNSPKWKLRVKQMMEHIRCELDVGE